MIGVGDCKQHKKAQKHPSVYQLRGMTNTTVLVLTVEIVYKFCGTPIGKKLIPSPYACPELLAVPSQQLPHMYGGASD